ncbi:Uncharacterized conserved protein [Collimonas sp. OK607]|uniref:MORN repeat-containing protein n=1 Tax=Collimonas sp. OK607 TaxID=1798194 RepID=UPI0008F1D4EF|nr:PEGA domain-containing protein [Collimonas sp. OK607]SFA84947.1 Uncharacterized conserved protein [Collimonas sp. OK607]
MTTLRLIGLTVLLTSAHAFAADSYVRLTCDEEDRGSDVVLDGDYKGKCPVDITTKPGSHRLEVATKKDGKYKLVYSVDVPLGAGVAQRIELPKAPAYSQPPEWDNFWARRTPFPVLMRGVTAGSPLAKAELALNYLADSKGCYFLLNMPEDMHASVKSWSGACKGGAGSGPGELVWSVDGIQEYGRLTGNFVQGKIEGQGKQIFHNGENFEGMFVGGQQRGRGVQMYANGDRYEGDFQDWKTTVKGILIKKNGDRYEGELRNGQMNGKGVLISADGTRTAGKFERNKFIGPE